MIVLDTHILIWWVSANAELTSVVSDRIAHELESGEVIISSISAWEVAMLVQKNRLVLSMDVDAWLTNIASIPRVRFYPVDNEIAVKSATLPGEFHKDPADRMIVATARQLGCTLLTLDEKIRNYPHVKNVC